jgi:hypothetical protein
MSPPATSDADSVKVSIKKNSTIIFELLSNWSLKRNALQLHDALELELKTQCTATSSNLDGVAHG